MITVQATNAKARLAELLRAVEHGEEVAITRHGKTIAHLVPARDTDAEQRQAALDRFEALKKTWKKAHFSTEEILAARHEGHRY